ncbi:WD40-repeat-containing domain protein [Rhodocollybia butyracea]|uniref:WD40-repeat-containing domain protein n=1 Tax=Rhodocollybia butyracea TaxID=206335 RepID=A0A9P5Q696_9AGAR|nr:WD40-repeat-containing domain protein [Rhodocollybia butyracea]
MSDSQPWFENLRKPHPFIHQTRIDLPQKDRIVNIAPFPEAWTSSTSYSSIWSSVNLFDVELGERLVTETVDAVEWNTMINKFKTALAVAGEQNIYIIWPFSSTRPIQIVLPEVSKPKHRLQPKAKANIAWALSPDKPYRPLLIFTWDRQIYILDAYTGLVEGCLRGHGGEITSIVVHPSAANMFCTTSRDLTSRIYDLTRPPNQKPNNPHQPPLKTPSLAGPAHGLDVADEGTGIGRCVLVLRGNRSGGHKGEVLGAAFHSALPVIATCGMDRTVKIWHIPHFSKRTEQRLLQEDKPLFSSTMIHKARILSVSWLTGDILLTHSASSKVSPASVRATSLESDLDSPEDEPGTCTLWKWLSSSRFFPPGWNEDIYNRQQRLRGFGSNHASNCLLMIISTFIQQFSSASFRILANYHFPAQPSQYTIHVLSGCTRGPFLLFLYSGSRFLTLVNVSLFKPCPPQPRWWPENGKMDPVMKKHMSEEDGQLRGWNIELDDQDSGRLETCAMLAGGRLIIAGGTEGSLWFWVDKS